MKEHPILFSSEMVRAILDGRKTQTRRIVTLLPHWKAEGLTHNDLEASGFWNASGNQWQYGDERLRQNYQVGDRLWVRESIKIIWTIDHGYGLCYAADPAIPNGCGRADDRKFYCASGCCNTGLEVGHNWLFETYCGDYRNEPWRPGIHMPRWASRITLEIADIRVERLKEITEEDAKAEGVTPSICPPYGHLSNRSGFCTLWDKINSKRASWESNPWVWAITFRREVSR